MNPLRAQETATAKQFLIDRVIEQAQADAVPLSAVEKTMLGFSEATATPEEMSSAETLENEQGRKQYEAKIAKLLRGAHDRDRKSSAEASWRRALTALNEDDCYLLVMVGQAGIKIPGRWRVIARAYFQKQTIIPLFCLGVVGLGGWLFFFPIRNISPTPLRAYVVHSEGLVAVLFVVWIGLLWLIGEILRRT